MQRDDAVRLRHILDAAKEACEAIQGRNRSVLDDRILSLALVRLIEIIGEAAANVSKDCRNSHPEIPWSSIVGMRNRLIHAYFDIDLDRVWDTLTDDLPPLISMLEKITSKESL